jgi:hypothetical protein
MSNGLHSIRIPAVKHSSVAFQMYIITNVFDTFLTDPTQCNLPEENGSLVWDGVCFGCLIMMRRFFKSYYFIHQVNEKKAMTILASRYILVFFWSW